MKLAVHIEVEDDLYQASGRNRIGLMFHSIWDN